MIEFFALSYPHTQSNENRDENEICFFIISCMSFASEQFTKSLSEVVYREFGLKLQFYFCHVAT